MDWTRGGKLPACPVFFVAGQGLVSLVRYIQQAAVKLARMDICGSGQPLAIRFS